jgi:hypothetical protein
MESFFCQPRMKVLLTVMLLITVTLSACSILPPEARQPLDEIYEELKKYVFDSLKQGVQQELQKLTQNVKDLFTAGWEEILTGLKISFGIEAPVNIGQVLPGTQTETSEATIRQSFTEAWKNAGGARVIGLPNGSVHDWEQSNPKLLIQYFEGGSEKNSAIVLLDGEDKAYLLSGKFLKIYTDLGGPNQAGYPTSNAKSWNIKSPLEVWTRWGRGKRQLFTFYNREYALLKPSGLDAVYLVPPKLYQTYLSASDQIGYPLSNYPLDDTDWQKKSSYSPETSDILREWERQPFRGQVFENGSLFWLNYGDQVDVVEYGKVTTFLNFGEVNLLLGVRKELGDLYYDLIHRGTGSECYINTVRHGANTAADAAGKILIPQVAFIPLRATLTVTFLKVDTLLGKFALSAASALVDLAGGTALPKAVRTAVAGRVIDSIYTKAVGDIISIPLSETTMLILEEEVGRLNRGRMAFESSVKKGSYAMDMDAKLNIEYDPITRTLTGVIVSDCAPQGYAFFYRVDPDTGNMAAATQVWDKKIRFIDLATGEELP